MVVQWNTLPKREVYYATDGKSGASQKIAGAVYYAHLDKIEEDCNFFFCDFDMDGENNIIDAITFLHSGYDASRDEKVGSSPTRGETDLAKAPMMEFRFCTSVLLFMAYVGLTLVILVSLSMSLDTFGGSKTCIPKHKVWVLDAMMLWPTLMMALLGHLAYMVPSLLPHQSCLLGANLSLDACGANCHFTRKYLLY